jgi:hypothetical protein
MAMTKKHFVKIAQSINAQRYETPGKEVGTALDELARVLAGFFAQDNAQFDRARFLEACGMNEK